jgi:hypothetical protein
VSVATSKKSPTLMGLVCARGACCRCRAGTQSTQWRRFNDISSLNPVSFNSFAQCLQSPFKTSEQLLMLCHRNNKFSKHAFIRIWKLSRRFRLLHSSKAASSATLALTNCFSYTTPGLCIELALRLLLECVSERQYLLCICKCNDLVQAR